MAPSLRMSAALLIVAMISAGQILFKLAAQRISASAGHLTGSALSIVALSIALYGIATLGWIWILQSYPLSRIYPVMALSFVLVPIGGALIFGERLTLPFFGGTALLLLGLILVMGSPA